MTGRRAIFGLCMLCAMAFSAIVAQGAAASGQTAFTCVSTAEVKDFSSEHCVPGETGTSFGHVAITEETHAKFSNANTNATTTGPTNAILQLTIAATNFEFEVTGAIEGLGTLKNEEVGGEMQSGAESNAEGITFNGVIVKAPANEGCKVFEDNGGVQGVEGVVKTHPVKGHTTTAKMRFVEGEREIIEPVDSVVIEPAEAGSTVFATFFVECEPGKGFPGFEGTWTIKGKLTCPTHGATIACERTTVRETGTLIGNGVVLGFTGKSTVTAGKFPVTEPTSPVSVTTTTP